MMDKAMEYLMAHPATAGILAYLAICVITMIYLAAEAEPYPDDVEEV
jgi:hypothetical protein